VKGITSLAGQLFVVRERQSVVTVYNIPGLTEDSQIQVDGLKCSQSLVACSHNNCLYISNGGFSHKDTLDIFIVKLSDRLMIDTMSSLSK